MPNDWHCWSRSAPFLLLHLLTAKSVEGAAGLYCGLLLAEAGHRVKIFEASDRAGGRIFTYRDPENPSAYRGEFGAMRFPLDMQPYLNRLIRQRYVLNVSEFVNSNNNGYIYMNGIRVRMREFDANPDVLQFNVTESERHRVSRDDVLEVRVVTSISQSPFRIYTEAMDTALKSLEEGGWSLARDRWDSYSLESYLHQMNVSLNTRNFIAAVRGTEYSQQTSVLTHIRSTLLFSGASKFYRIENGNDRLVQAMVDECQQMPSNRCSIVYASPVNQVITNRSNPIRLTTRNGSEESFDRIIVATTAKAAELIDFKPRTTFREKYRAFRQIYYVCGMKILLFFNHSWWATQENIHGGQSSTDLNLRQVYYPLTINNQTNGGTLLASYVTGYGALLWQSLSHDDVIEFALKQLIELHASSSNLRDFYVRGRVHHWCGDPYAHAAFAYFTPLQETKFLGELQTPIERVHFIGEHTSLMVGWVEGSLVSALRAALDISREQENTFDVIIMGGNLLDLTTAMFLSMKQPQWRIALVDRSSSSSSSSWTLHQRRFRRIYAEDHLTELATLSLTLWRQIEQQMNVTRGSILNTDDGFLFFGRFNTSRETTEDDLASIRRSCQRLQLDCEHLNRSQLQNRYPFLTLPNDYEGIFDRQSGFVNVTQLTQSLLAYISEQPNIVIREQEEFLSFRLLNNGTSVIITDRGVLSASKRVVFLPGSYVKNVSELLNLDLPVTLWELPVFHFRRLASVTRSPTWIEYGNHNQQDVFAGFSIDPTSDYVVIEPTFIADQSSPLIYPSQKTNRVDGWVRQRMMSWAETYLRGLVNLTDVYAFDNDTYLWTSIDGGFVLDYVPETDERMLIHSTSVGTSFVAVWADMISEMVTSTANGTHRYSKYLPHVSLSRFTARTNGTVVSSARRSWAVWLECCRVIISLFVLSVFI